MKAFDKIYKMYKNAKKKKQYQLRFGIVEIKGLIKEVKELQEDLELKDAEVKELSRQLEEEKNKGTYDDLVINVDGGEF